MKQLILIRHGQSIYNLENRFTGWKDVDLTDKGIQEAKNASKLLKDYNINAAYTSKLKRAQNTLSIILDNLDLKIPVTKDIRLNERNYGNLVDQNKAEASLKYGANQVQLWRRSYDIPPPEGESLKDTYNRCIPYFKTILNVDKNIIISAHGNSIRAIVKYLLNISEEDILKTEIGWCEPWIFTLKDNKVKNLKILHFEKKSNSNLPIKLNF
jgi:2,3-bisphosphoglycerate-dependent phosphoglycerate mutase